MKTLPEDGSLKEITASDSNSEINLMIIQIPEELVEPGGNKYAFATLDRSKEGVEWPADKILEKLVPGLPKVKLPEASQTDAIIKTNSLHRHSTKRKFNQRPFHKKDLTTRQSKPPQKRFRSDRPGNVPTDDIDPWVYKPWENQELFVGMNTTASVSATPLLSSEPFNNFYRPTLASSYPLPSEPSRNIFNVPNNNTYEKDVRPTAASNIPFVNSHLRRPPLANRMPLGPPPPSFPIPNRFSRLPNRELCGPVMNPELSNPSHQTSLLGEPSIVRHQVKHGLLGDRPFPNMPFNRNMPRFPNSLSSQSNHEGNGTTLFPDEKNVSEQSNFLNQSSYDASYGRISRSNFDQYVDKNKNSEKEPYDSKTNSFQDVNKASCNRYRNSGSSVNQYEDQYRDSYNHNHPKNNNDKEFLMNSRGFHKRNKRFREPSAGVGHSESSYKEVGDDNQCKRNYDDGRISGTSKTTFVHNQNGDLKEDSLIHISNSTVVYNPEDFPNDAYPATTTNSLTSRSSPSIRRNINTKNTLEKRCTTSKFAHNNYNRMNRGKYNQGRRRYRNRQWKTPQE